MTRRPLHSISERLAKSALPVLGAGVLLRAGGRWLGGGALSGASLVAGLSALTTVLACLVPRAGLRWAAPPAVLMGMSGATALALSHERPPLPVLSWAAVLSLDSPALLYPAALLLLLGTALGATRAGARGRRWLRAAALLGCAGVVAYWATPQFFYLEEVDRTQQGGMPIVVDGALEQHPWRRDVYGGTPLLLLPQLIYGEWTRADLAYGLDWALAQAEGSPESIHSALARYDALWRIQKSLSAGYFYLSAAAAITCVPLALLLLIGTPSRPVGAAVTALLCGVTLAVPLLNLALLAALWGFHLAGPELAAMTLEELELLGLFLAVLLAALTLARSPGASSGAVPA